MTGRGAGEPRRVALGASGRPLHPVGALFEAAFRRFGQRMVAYLLYAAACAVPLAVVAWAISAGDISGWPAFFTVSLAWALGHLALVGILAGLVTGELRERAGSIAIAVVVGAVIIAIPAALLPPFGLAAYPFVVFGPIAAAAGDREGVHAVAYGARLAGRYIGRAALVVFGLVILSLFLWFGFVVALSPVTATVRQVGAFAAVTLIVWPVAALVARNLYGDLTGRLVIREAAGEAERQADLERRGRRRR